MNRPDYRSKDGDKDNGSGNHGASKVREAVEELVHHNDERSPEQKEQFRLMAAFVARLCVGGGGGGGKSKAKSSALSWPSANGRCFPGLVDAVFDVLGKVSCNVSIAISSTMTSFKAAEGGKSPRGGIQIVSAHHCKGAELSFPAFGVFVLFFPSRVGDGPTTCSQLQTCALQ